MATVYGTNNAETLDAADGVTNLADTIFGLNGNDVIFGLGGNDNIKGGGGADTINGGSGFDMVFYDDSPTGVTVSLASGTGSGGTAQGDVLISIEGIWGSINDDYLYGNDGSNELYGSAGNDHLFGGGGQDYLDGGDGNDTIHFNNNLQGLVVSLVNHWSHSDGTDDDFIYNVENVVGTQNGDIFRGDDANNRMYGLGGDDDIRAGNGDDELVGGPGADYLDGELGTDIASYSESPVAVTVNLDTHLGSGGDAEGDHLHNIEIVIGSDYNDTLIGSDDLTDRLYGREGSDTLKGGGGADYLYGGSGNDSLYGEAGSDMMTGGLGDDSYNVDSPSDFVIEWAGQGTDTVYTSVDFILPGGVEILKTAVPSATNPIKLIGNELDNTIYGNAGANILDGGTGQDTLYGNAGNDTLYGNSAGDALYGGTGDDIYHLSGGALGVYENAGEGTDWVHVGTNHTLGANIENLVLTDSGSLIGNGNALNNWIFSNGANCELVGGEGSDTLFGGAGVDSMYGGAGNDEYYVHNSSAGALENPGEGIDWVYADVNYTLGSNVENLQLIGTSNLSGTGNVLDNMIFSNGADCTLFGGGGNDTLLGGTGVDMMYGSVGDDIYYVHNSAAGALENAGEGTDWVYADVSYVLGSHVENIVLTGNGNISATGNAGDNRIEGNSGDNTLTGNGGADRFVFAAQGFGHDTITDFDADNAAAGHDLIDLSAWRLNFGSLTINQVGADTQILIGGNEITLANVNAAQVDAGDFLF